MSETVKTDSISRDELLALLRKVPAALSNAFSAGIEEREFGSANRQERLMQPVHELRAAIDAALSLANKDT